MPIDASHIGVQSTNFATGPAKSKGKIVVSLLSTAATGFRKHILVNRGAPVVKQVRYDPIGMSKIVETSKNYPSSERLVLLSRKITNVE